MRAAVASLWLPWKNMKNTHVGCNDGCVTRCGHCTAAVKHTHGPSNYISLYISVKHMKPQPPPRTGTSMHLLSSETPGVLNLFFHKPTMPWTMPPLWHLAMVGLVSALNESNESDPNADFYETNWTQPLLPPCGAQRPRETYQSAEAHDPGPASLGQTTLMVRASHLFKRFFFFFSLSFLRFLRCC